MTLWEAGWCRKKCWLTISHALGCTALLLNLAKKRATGLYPLKCYPLKLPRLSFLSGGTWSCLTFFSRDLMSSE